MKIKIIYFLTLAGIFIIALIVNLALFQRIFRTDPAEVTLKIKRGDNLRNIAVELEEKQVIENKSIFIFTGRLLGYQDEIIPGEYNFPNGLTNLDILKKITDPGSVRYFTVTIPEGLNVRQMGRLLQRQLGLDSARFVEATYNDSLISMLGINADNLEGFLFPDTYRISFSPSGNTEGEIVSIMAANFRKKITPEMREEMKDEDLDLTDVVTMASIIEGETRYEPEKKTIAGVYYNRLRKHMKLEADPTVQYAIPNGPKRRLVYSDLKYPSPYNTYLHRGLPPGPINNPGLSSIIAAISPEKNNYLYFVAKGDGSHRFAETYREHKANIQLYKEYLQQKEENTDK
jgi:peptidoglycan lytic transglycosylase G